MEIVENSPERLVLAQSESWIGVVLIAAGASLGAAVALAAPASLLLGIVLGLAGLGLAGFGIAGLRARSILTLDRIAGQARFARSGPFKSGWSCPLGEIERAAVIRHLRQGQGQSHTFTVELVTGDERRRLTSASTDRAGRERLRDALNAWLGAAP